MSVKKDITIVGAGPSGLVAGINLNREGYNVIIREKQKKIGGEPGWHPSVHGTPVSKDLWKYIGIDCSEAFADALASNKMFFNWKEISKDIPGPIKDEYEEFKRYGLFNTERGPRKTSLDSFLFRIAEKEGVNFEFGKGFKPDDFNNAPDNTIIATGLSPGFYEAAGIDYSIFAGYWSYSEISGNSVTAGGYMGDFTNEYAYAGSMNGIWYVLLFARKEVAPETLSYFKENLERVEGRTFDKWHTFRGQTPKGPRLFHKNLVLTGTAAGFIEPARGFGITGSLLSGKIAAMTVMDRAKGEAEFKKYTDGIITHIARKRKPGYIPTFKTRGIWFEIE